MSQVEETVTTLEKETLSSTEYKQTVAKFQVSKNPE